MVQAGKRLFQHAADLAGGDQPLYAGARMPTYGTGAFKRLTQEEREGLDILGQRKYQPFLDESWKSARALGQGYDQMTRGELLGPRYRGATRGQLTGGPRRGFQNLGALIGSYDGQTRRQLMGPGYEGATRRQLRGGPRRGFQSQGALIGGPFGGPTRQELIGESADIGKFSLADAQPYMDIYQQAADPAIEEIRRQAAQQQGQLSAQAAGAGAFGGSRQAIQSAMLGAEGARAAGNLRARAAQEGLGFAAGRFEADRQARMTQAERDRAARFGAESAMMGRREAERAARFRAGDIMEQRRQADIASGFQADTALQDRYYKARQLGMSVDDLMRRQFESDRAARFQAGDVMEQRRQADMAGRFQAENVLRQRHLADQQARLGAEAAGRAGFETQEAARLRRAQQLENYPQMVRSLNQSVAAGKISAGEARRKLDQTAADLAYADYKEQMMYPFEKTNWLMGVLGGVPHDIRTTGFTSGVKQAQTPSLWGQLFGALGTVGSAYAMRNRG